MPYKRKYFRKPKVMKKRRFIRRMRRRANPRLNVSTIAGISSMQKLRYVNQTTLVSLAGGKATHVYNANDLFQPDVTSLTPHQPMKFDQLSAFYNSYVVVGSKITVRLVGSTGTGGTAVPVCWGISLDDNQSVPGDYDANVEQGRASYKISNLTNAERQSVLTKKFSAKKFFNVTNIKDNVSRIGAFVSASPPDQAGFVLWMQSLDKATSSATIRFLVTIDYIALFSEPKDLAQS